MQTMRFGLAAVAIAGLALAGCGKADDGPKTMEEAKQEAAKLDRPKPGQYTQSMKITKFEMADAPPEMAKQMQATLGQQQATSFCLTDQMADEGYQEMFREVSRDGQCKYDRFNVSGGTLDAVMKCDSPAEGQGTIKLNGKVSSEGSDITVEIDSTNSESTLGRTVIGMKMSTKRTGDCPK